MTPTPAIEGTRLWIVSTITAAVGLTIFDAALLQQKKSFFTGGFLSAVHAESALQSVGFLLLSVIVDASLIGLVAAGLLWATARLKLTTAARYLFVTAGAAGPFLIWAFIRYRLVSYLGDAFDLGLMFDLTGRSPGEILAVASGHLLEPAALAVGSTAALVGVVWTINRYGPGSSRDRVSVHRRLLARPVALFVVGLLGFTAASTASDLAEDGLRRKASGQFYTHLVDGLTDFDRDGFGITGRNRDTAPFSATIFPYALDVPGNGIDENGVGGDLPVSGNAYREGRHALDQPARWPERPDVVLFVLESFRADAVGRVVNGTPVTPYLTALGREGATTERAFSHNGYTTQSRFHLLTGSLADVRRDGSLIDDFKAQGYEVAYFSGQDESFGGEELGVGFDRADVAYDARMDRDKRYSRFTTPGSLAVSHATLRGRIEEFLATRDRTRPLFLYVNFHDTHFPYHHDELAPLVSDQAVAQSDIVPRRRGEVQAMYYNAAANVDRALGATVAGVTQALGEPPAVIVTSDHGESLFDEGFLGHGYALNDIQTRIPLIVRGLAIEIVEPFAQVDLRDAIVSALSRPGGAAGAPRVRSDSDQRVFQYLGDIHRPRQIAFVSGAGRLVYDFRDRRVTLPGGRTVGPGALTGEDEERFLELVQYWERMMLARSPAGGSAIN